MFKLFTKDLLDRQRLLKYFIYAIVAYAVLDGLLKNRQDIVFNERFLIFAAVALAGSIFYYIRGYVANDRILSYYALPVSNQTLNRNFILAILIDTIFSKLILFFIALYLSKAPFDFYVKVSFIMLVITFFASAANTLNLSLGKFLLILAITLIALYVIINYSLLYGGIASLVAIVISSVLFKDAYFSTRTNTKINKLHIKNYFLKFALAESVYVINSISLIVMIIFASLALPEAMGLVIAFAVGAVNTPLLTMFSSSEGLRNYDKMFPDVKASLKKDYIKVLSIYFIIINAIIVLINLNKIQPRFLLIVNMVIVTIAEVFISYKLESDRPITNTKTQNEIWKHPRKYILPIVVFAISFIVLIMFKTF
ncbi:hypothetical protein [uncultured Anaerococcus sp.]|uniref:hypothetical protein n=1 Tax=uncultured Anaerococcus sp. TaxID=293428 RepID=UPI002639C06B|nr:hypothetical protein [uncultured Anaerococcus sp.]